MINIADIFRWLVDASAACMLLLVLAYGVMLLLKQPARRLRVGELALAGCIFLSIVQAIPATRFSFAVVEPGTPVRLPWFNDTLAANAVPHKAAIAPGPTIAASSPAPGSAPSVIAERLFSTLLISWRDVLVCLYAAGVLWMAGRLLAACLALRHLSRRAKTPSADTTALWKNLTARRDIRLAVSHDLDRPLTFGLRRPIVLLPASMAGAPAADLTAILRHELGHIERRDAAAWILAAAANVLLFFLPPLWLIKREMRLSQEFLADSVAADTTAGPIAYAEMLLRLVQNVQPLAAGRRAPRLATAASLTVGAWLSPSDLMLRIRHLFANRRPMERRVTRRWTLAAAFCVLALTSALGAVTLADTSLSTRVRAHELEGVAYLLRTQSANGGWLTQVGPAPTALVVRSLLQAGVPPTYPAILRARHYVDSCLQSDGGYYTNGEPTYHTAVVLSMFAAFNDADARARLEAGRHFLERDLARKVPAHGNWYNSPGGASPRQNISFADPSERSADAILDAYGSLTYAKWKSMVYAGLTESDPRVKQATRWLTKNWTLDKHPGTGSAEGLYYYYLAAAKTLRASGIQTFTDSAHHVHVWRKEIESRLLATQSKDGSWVNTQSPRWLEDRPAMVTAYALLALQEARK